MIQAVILAGGQGTRLRPLTKEIPKPMVEVNGKPFLEYQIELLKKYNIKDIVLSVGYLKEKIIDYFGNGQDFGVKIRYSAEDKPMGTGGALKLAEALLEDSFFVLNGDSYLDIDYMDVLDEFKDKDTKAMVVVYNNEDDTQVPNNISVENNFVVEYDKESKTGNFVDAGVMVLKKLVLDLIDKNRKVSLEKEIFEKLIKEKELSAYKTKKRFYDMGTPERLKKIEEELR